MNRFPLLVGAAFTTLGGLACVAGLVHIMRGTSAQVQRRVASTVLAGYGLALVIQPDLGWCRNVLVLAAAAAGALWLSLQFRTPESVAVFLITAAAVDLFSFSGGVTHRIMAAYRAGTSDLLLFLSLSVPLSGRVVPVVGIGDLLVGGAAAGVLMRLGVPPWQVGLWLSGGLLVALLVGITIGGAPAIPAIAAAVVTMLWWRRRRRRPRPTRQL